MKTKSLALTNPHLKNKKKAYALLVRSIASSTAIETGESIELIEKKIIRLHASASRVGLA